jgi:GNAT superfamily N-acetyltransferase
MSEVQVRPFRRPDREQLTALVNAHVQAVVPGVSVSVNTVMSQLERDPGEFIVDPWVAERSTLVAEQRGRMVAAAHLLRYGTGAEVGETIRGAGEINWLLYWPEASYWPDSTAAAGTLMAACLDQLRRWPATRSSADGALPAPGVYDLPEQWPHIRRRGVATWLVGQAADWLRLARVERLLEYAWPEERDLLGLLGGLGFRELARTARGWVHRPGT